MNGVSDSVQDELITLCRDRRCRESEDVSNSDGLMLAVAHNIRLKMLFQRDKGLNDAVTINKKSNDLEHSLTCPKFFFKLT